MVNIRFYLRLLMAGAAIFVGVWVLTQIGRRVQRLLRSIVNRESLSSRASADEQDQNHVEEETAEIIEICSDCGHDVKSKECCRHQQH